MAIISTIGRRDLKVRLLIGAIYAGLSIGALTMIYPFLLMIAGSTKSAVDTPDPHVVPPYLKDRTALYQKHTEALFNESFEMMRVAYATDTATFQDLQLPERPNAKFAGLWEQFLRETELPFYAYMIGETHAPRSRGVLPFRLRQFKAEMVQRFDGDIKRFNEEMQSEYVNWNAFYVLPEEYLLRRSKPTMRPMDQAFRAFKARQPLSSRYVFSVEGYYRMAFLYSKFSGDIAKYNAAHGTELTGWEQVRLTRACPPESASTVQERADWELFLRTLLNLYWIRADSAAAGEYRAFLAAKYQTIGALNRSYSTDYASWAAIPLVGEPPAAGLVQADWASFIEGWRDPNTQKTHRIALEHLRVHSVDFMFRDWLNERFGTPAAMNAEAGTAFADWAEILGPQQDMHVIAFTGAEAALRREFTTRNFVTVIDFIVLHGRGILNTVIYCGLAILAALIVNPLAAYALSRYKPPSTYKILLFLMMTMAFPPMVTQIPNFLMLRELGLLNSFWALILPGLANGYSIFLLKGFFDSLPQELYESAAIDGAGEFRIFWQITMSLSTPILAVIALNAFTAAYSNFMMALLICQDESMWTLMPWLYQLQMRSGEGVVFASLLIAAIPTFFVFVTCQNVIMRGIVVPVEK